MIEHTNRICDWLENLPKDEMPPQWMWAHEDELKVWFEEVEHQRELKYGGDSHSSSSSVTEVADMESNEATALVARDMRG